MGVGDTLVRFPMTRRERLRIASVCLCMKLFSLPRNPRERISGGNENFCGVLSGDDYSDDGDELLE